MGALVRAELLMELLTRVSAELLTALGWQGAVVVILGTLVSRSLRGSGAESADDPAPRGPVVNVACVTTVLLAVLLLDGLA